MIKDTHIPFLNADNQTATIDDVIKNYDEILVRDLEPVPELFILLSARFNPCKENNHE